MQTLGINIALTNCREIRFMLSTPNEDIDAGALKFGIINNVIPNITDKNIIVDFGVQYAYNGEPIMECRYAFQFDYKESEDGALIKMSDNGINMPEDIMKTIINISSGAIRGIMIARTVGTYISKFPLPLLDLKSLMKDVKVIPPQK